MIGEVFTENSTSKQNIKWIYHENEEGNIEITGMDLLDEQVEGSAGYFNIFLKLEGDILKVPSKIDGKKVVSFVFKEIIAKEGEGQFTGEFARISIAGIKSLQFEDGITELPEHFKGIDVELEEMILPKGLKTINKIQWSGIKKIYVPEGVTSIKDGAFIENQLEYVSLPSTLTSIGLKAFGEKLGRKPWAGTLEFPNGKNTNLTIPENNWEANKIIISGVEYTTP